MKTPAIPLIASPDTRLTQQLTVAGQCGDCCAGRGVPGLRIKFDVCVDLQRNGVSAVAEALEVSPSELHLTAEKIDSHAGDFATAHQVAHWRASQATLGSGAAGSALPEMLGVWESDATRFAQHFAKHADGHRAAANAFVRAEGGSVARIGDAGSAM